KKTITNYLITILLFCAGLWAVYEHSIFMAVLLLALAANFNRQSSHHILVSEIMGAHRLLAMLINKQSQDIELLRGELSRSPTSGDPHAADSTHCWRSTRTVRDAT